MAYPVVHLLCRMSLGLCEVRGCLSQAGSEFPAVVILDLLPTRALCGGDICAGRFTRLKSGLSHGCRRK